MSPKPWFDTSSVRPECHACVVYRWSERKTLTTNGLNQHDLEGRVASSKLDSHCIACSRDSPHISDEGRSPPQKVGRSSLPNTAQRLSSSSCAHLTPAGLPCGMPGKGEVMEGAIQQAPHSARHCIIMLCDRPRRPASRTRWTSLACLFPAPSVLRDLLSLRSRARPARSSSSRSAGRTWSRSGRSWRTL